MRTWIAIAMLALGAMAQTGIARAEPAPDVVARTNAYRAARGLAPLTVSPALQAAAEAHGRDMARRGFFAHEGSDGSSVAKRVGRQGYQFCVIAENIAMGQATPGTAMETWIGSRPHRRNLLLRKATEIGVSRQRGNIWVMVLGSRMGNC